MECYNFKKNVFEKGIYDKSVDATYIITMENNKIRHKNIYKQLKKCKLTKTTYIVFSKVLLSKNPLYEFSKISSSVEGFTYCNKDVVQKFSK